MCNLLLSEVFEVTLAMYIGLGSYDIAVGTSCGFKILMFCEMIKGCKYICIRISYVFEIVVYIVNTFNWCWRLPLCSQVSYSDYMTL